MPNLIVLVVEDRQKVVDLVDSLERLVEQWPNVDIHSAENFFTAAIWINSTQRIDLLLSDVLLPGEMSGIDIADLAVKTHPEVAVVLFSTDDCSGITGLRGKYEFVRKPFDREQLTVNIDNAFSKLHASAEWLLELSLQANAVNDFL